MSMTEIQKWIGLLLFKLFLLLLLIMCVNQNKEDGCCLDKILLTLRSYFIQLRFRRHSL